MDQQKIKSMKFNYGVKTALLGACGFFLLVAGMNFNVNGNFEPWWALPGAIMVTIAFIRGVKGSINKVNYYLCNITASVLVIPLYFSVCIFWSTLMSLLPHPEM